MTQLKTLKDLTLQDADPTAEVIYADELKAEAMEHYFYAMKSGKIKLGNWIKHFFNLSEGDLK